MPLTAAVSAISGTFGCLAQCPTTRCGCDTDLVKSSHSGPPDGRVGDIRRIAGLDTCRKGSGLGLVIQPYSGSPASRPSGRSRYVAQLRTRSCPVSRIFSTRTSSRSLDRDVMGLDPGLDTVGATDWALAWRSSSTSVVWIRRGVCMSLGMSAAATLKPYSYSSPNIGQVCVRLLRPSGSVTSVRRPMTDEWIRPPLRSP